MIVFLISALILSGFTSCTGQDTLTVSFQMYGITGSAAFNLEQQNLTVTITVSQSLGTGPASVEIRPIWVDYDVADKCSITQLGSAIPGLSKSLTFTNNTAVAEFSYTYSLLSLGGSSIVVNGSSKAVCASIEADVVHPTAVAQFQGLVQGTVFFRQSISGLSTRIVSDLFSGQAAYSGSWLISDVDSCSLVTTSSQLKVFNPSNSTGTSCAQASPQSCAVGQLSDKLGNVTIGVNKNEARLAYTDRNLPSIIAIDSKLLVIRTSSDSLACAVIRVFLTLKAMVEFNHDGVTGSVTFSQTTPFDSTATEVNLIGLNLLAKGYHVHLWPTPTKIVDGQDLCGANIVSGHFNPYNKNVSDPGYPTPDNSTDDMYETGDLSSKYGTLEQLSTMSNRYTDWNLPLYGQNSIIGRSLVIHHNDASASRWVCANIQPVGYTSVAAIAVFKYPVIGQIMFIQGENHLETSVFAQLDYNDGRPGTKNHTWAINTNMVTNDMLSTEAASRCLSTGTIYNPENVLQSQYNDYCKRNSPLGCKLGDLSGKLGFLNIRNAASSDTSTKHFFTDVNLPLSGPYSIIGKSIAIMNEQGDNILACANIQILRDPLLTASFSMGNVSGRVTFQQMAGFGAKKTTVMNDLHGLKDKYRLWIYELPLSIGKNDCSGLGSVFNPLNITETASLTATDDKYAVGDLSHFGIKANWNNFNLPLMGLISINKRSLVIVDQDSQNKIVACAKIDTQVLPLESSQFIEAVSTFTGVVDGTVHLYQTIYSDGTMSDTSILVDLSRQDGQKSLRHNWHTHLNPVGNDANAQQSPCTSAGPHFDPYIAIQNQQDLTNYKKECRPDNPLRCELGDQASKLSAYDVGGGQKLFTDVDLPLAGKYSVQGRSMVLHEKDKGTPRLACADIIPVTNDAVTVKIKSAASLDRRDVARVYAEAIKTEPTNVVVEFISQSGEITEVHVHFLGFQRTAQRTSFLAILDGNNDILKPYIPYSTGAGNYAVVSIALLLAVFTIQLLNYL